MVQLIPRRIDTAGFLAFEYGHFCRSMYGRYVHFIGIDRHITGAVSGRIIQIDPSHIYHFARVYVRLRDCVIKANCFARSGRQCRDGTHDSVSGLFHIPNLQVVQHFLAVVCDRDLIMDRL